MPVVCSSRHPANGSATCATDRPTTMLRPSRRRRYLPIVAELPEKKMDDLLMSFVSLPMQDIRACACCKAVTITAKSRPSVASTQMSIIGWRLNQRASYHSRTKDSSDLASSLCPAIPPRQSFLSRSQPMAKDAREPTPFERARADRHSAQP